MVRARDNASAEERATDAAHARLRLRQLLCRAELKPGRALLRRPGSRLGVRRTVARLQRTPSAPPSAHTLRAGSRQLSTGQP